MPTYAYRCKDCGHAFDAIQSFSDDALTECPACGGVLRKQYGSVGVSFKGSGVYRTDSRGGTGGGTGGGDGAKASSGGAASGSDSGSAATTTSGGGSAD